MKHNFVLSQNNMTWKKYNHETKDCLLDLPKTNFTSCLITTETPEPAADIRRTSHCEAALGG